MWQDKDSQHVIRSPIDADPSELPIIPLAEYALEKVEENFDQWKSKLWMVDVVLGTSVTFGDALEKSRNVANALAKLGFKQGDVLYFVTYEMAQLHVVEVAVWMLGGALRGCYQREKPEVYARQISESKSRLVLVDAETAPTVKEAIGSHDLEVQLLSVGPIEVEGAIGYDILSTEEDTSALPEFIDVNPREEAVVIPNTSGSTGVPKGVVHTHYSAVAQSAMMEKIDYFPMEKSAMALMANYAIGNFSLVILTLRKGATMYNISKFSMDAYFDLMLQFKPHGLMFYPFVASWFARSRQLNELDLSFIKKIYIGASVLDPTTADILHQKLPHASLHQVYGMTEVVMIAATDLTAERDTEEAKPLPIIESNGELYVSTGQIMPYVKAKIADVTTGESLPKGERGEILLKSASLMKGYLIDGDLNRANPDDWFHTGDLGFFDDDENIYVVERISFMFKYHAKLVSPSEIESVLIEHPAIQAVGVVGVPDVEADGLARAFVVLAPGQQSNEDELCAFVADKLPDYKHLHGGVRFLDKLPMNRGGKLDRGQLKAMAIKEVEADMLKLENIL